MPANTRTGDSIAPKYADFDIVDITYKKVRETAIPASVLIPKNIEPKRAPIAVHWHGGGLIVGQRLFPEWYTDWVLALALQNGAVTISPDYRLLPEAKGVDILEDARDFYAWLFKPGNLAQYLPEGIEPDLEDILVIGESAGGWFAIQSGFLIPDRIASVVAQYPMIDMRSAHFTQDYHKDLFEPPAPQLDRKLLEDHIAGLTGDEVVSARIPPDGLPLVLVALQSGRFGSLFGQESELYPLEQLDREQRFPPLWIIHGDQDNVVPVEGTHKFADAFKARFPNVPFHLTIRPGEAHGFDNHEAATGVPASLDTDWVKPGVELLQRFWHA